MTLTVHHLSRSRSHRVLWALEELGLTYELRVYERNPRTLLAPPELLQVHPLGKAPVLTDGELTLAESGAILEYLGARHGRLVPPPGSPEHLRYVYWLHYAEGSLMPILLLGLILARADEAPALVRPVVKTLARHVETTYSRPNLDRHLDFIEQSLAAGPWFAGDELTMADIQMSYPLEAAVERASAAQQRPRLREYVQRLRARPAYQRAIERGGETIPHW